MTVTELGTCHYFATVGNAKAYSREVEVSRIPLEFAANSGRCSITAKE